MDDADIGTRVDDAVLEAGKVEPKQVVRDAVGFMAAQVGQDDPIGRDAGILVGHAPVGQQRGHEGTQLGGVHPFALLSRVGRQRRSLPVIVFVPTPVTRRRYAASGRS